MDVKILSFVLAEQHLTKKDLDISDVDYSLSIPSNLAFVYSLDNGEILVIPTDLAYSEYPAVLFENKSDFLQCCKEEKFPIPDTYLKWLEKNVSNVQNFPKEYEFCQNSLLERLNLNLPFKGRDDIYEAYKQACKLLKTKSLKDDEIDDIAYGFAFEVIKYFIEEKGYSYELVKNYEMYNPYYYPYLVNNGNKVDIISLLFSALEGKSENSFIGFYHFATTPM